MTLPLSIIVPIHRFGAAGIAELEACLHAIRTCEGGDGLEVIVVDDASPEGAAIAAAARRHGARLERLEENSGPAVARNRGAALANQQILVFLDADTVPHADTLLRLHLAFEKDPELAAVFGSYDDAPSDAGLVSRFRNLLHHWVHQHSRKEASTFWAGCGAIRRTAFVSIGGFDASYRQASIEDVALGMSMTAAGFRIELHPEIQVTHSKRWTLASALRTDLFGRAVPWTMAVWRGAPLPDDLNFTWKHKASALLAVCCLAGWAASLWLSLAAALLLALLNLPFYRFLWSRDGVSLTVTGFVAHTLHYFVSVLGFVIGTLRVFPLLGLLPVLVFAVQWSTGAYSADWGESPDENAHAVTGLMASEWLRHPALDVVGFAERYYISYPVLGIGHWPPLFYLLDGTWVDAAGPSRAAALLLIAVLATLLLAVVYLLIRRRSSEIAAAAAVALVLFNRHFVESLSLVMIDVCAALAVIIAVLCWVRYLDQPSAKHSILFGIAASGCLLLKQSNLVLIPVPLLSVALTRRWDLLARAHFWLPPALVIAIAGPWHWYTLQTVYPNVSSAAALGRGTVNWALPFVTAGWGLGIAGCAGAVIALRKRPDSLQACCLALAVSCLLCVPLVGALNEPRHLLMLLPALALLAAPVLDRRWALAAVIVVFAALDLHWTRRPRGEYTPLVERLNRVPAGPVLLVANDFTETRLIAVIASRSPAPQRQWVRGSKFLAQVSWGGRVLSEAFPSLESMEAAIGQADLAGVLMLTKPEQAPLVYQEKLNAVLARQPDQWRRTVLSTDAVLYERSSPPPHPDRTVPFFVPRLRRRLGG